MALSDLIPDALKPPKPIGGKGDSSPRVSGVADDAMTPIIEPHEGSVIPYRGTEQHGIHPSEPYSDHRDELRKSVDVTLSPHPHPATPVLVTVVKSDGDEFTEWRVVSTLASGTPAQILMRNRLRTYARVTNSGAVTVYIGRDPFMNAYNNSFPIPAGGTIEMHHTEDVWVMSADGSNVDVRAYVEFKRV